MVGWRLGFYTLAAGLTLGATATHAADYAPPPPQPVYIPPPPVQECCEGWYLRGFIGVGMNGNYNLAFQQNPLNSSNFAFEQHSIGDTVFIGGGVGYEFNNWLRFEGSAEYRGKTQVNAFGSYTFGGGTFGDAYQGYLKSWVFLANAFVDLGTWDCFTPFVGAGIGGAYNTLADFTDIGIGTSGRGIGRNSSEWHTAWALYAGVSYNVSKNFKVDLTYRYLNYGSITDTIDCLGGCNPDSYKLDKLYSHDIMLGLRFTCCDFAPAPPRYVYAPPPPLRSKG